MSGTTRRPSYPPKDRSMLPEKTLAELTSRTPGVDRIAIVVAKRFHSRGRAGAFGYYTPNECTIGEAAYKRCCVACRNGRGSPAASRPSPASPTISACRAPRLPRSSPRAATSTGALCSTSESADGIGSSMREPYRPGRDRRESRESNSSRSSWSPRWPDDGAFLAVEKISSRSPRGAHADPIGTASYEMVAQHWYQVCPGSPTPWARKFSIAATYAGRPARSRILSLFESSSSWARALRRRTARHPSAADHFGIAVRDYAQSTAPKRTLHERQHAARCSRRAGGQGAAV